jgi:hypothetical protein
MFEKISVGIKTFLRDDKLFNVINDIRCNMPGIQMIIADCGEMTEAKDGLYAELEREGHIHIDLPFDSGFGCMSNEIIYKLTRPFLLTGSDDFDFTSNNTIDGISRLIYNLSYNPHIDILSGRVNNRPYEFNLLEDQPGEWREEAVHVIVDHPTTLVHCDLTVNYSLIRRDVFKKVGWDSDVRIGGGEHGAFFIDCKKAGFRTAYLPGTNINEQQVRNSPRYNMYRRRALDPARPCFVKRGIRKYIMGNGVVDYDAVNN